MDGVPQEPSLLKKIYFIKRAKKGEELTTLLKNKFKAIDAIRDLISWFEEGRDFVVTLVDWTEDAPKPASDETPSLFPDDDLVEPDAEDREPAAAPDSRRERKVTVSPWIPQAENHKNLIDVIGSIIYWLDTGRDFDIVLQPTDRYDVNLN